MKKIILSGLIVFFFVACGSSEQPKPSHDYEKIRQDSQKTYHELDQS